MKSQQMMTCNFCNGQGWINTHEACPICVGSGVVPMMNMPPVAKPKQQQPKQQQPPARQQQPVYQQQYQPQPAPVYQQQTPPVYQPVRQQQPVQNTGQELHIFVHSDQGQQEYQRSAVPATPTPAKGISIFQICCIGALILTILSWGGVI